ncbi:MAG TPA: ABC transporter permease [Anaeromyxobacter sp.]|nr:ABC transporter permease [Anaeromyxobacter sp.]
MTSLFDTIAMALDTLRANVLRSVLTLLGIVIGTSTVVAMMSLTEGLRLKIQNDFTVLGAGAFQISRFPAVVMGDVDWRKYERRQPITREQGDTLQNLPHVRYVSVEEWGEATWTVSTAYRATRQTINVGGVGPEAEPAHGGQAAQGRFIAATDVLLGRRVAFLGADVADVLFPGQDPVGQQVRIRGAAFEVIGVAQRMGSIFGESKDGFVCLPWTAYDIVLGKQRDAQLLIGAITPQDTSRAIDEVTAALRRARGVRPYEESDFEVFTNDTLSDLINGLAQKVGAATFGVCALALLVGGIGIMNIMLVSVSQRTREIGVRMALGARRRRILSQFLVESVTLSALGGLLGVMLGAGGALAAREVQQVPASIPAWAVILSLATACGAGLLFGIYPAARASKLDPVEAMRTE